jgi:hypothetical protein
MLIYIILRQLSRILNKKLKEGYKKKPFVNQQKAFW